MPIGRQQMKRHAMSCGGRQEGSFARVDLEQLALRAARIYTPGIHSGGHRVEAFRVKLGSEAERQAHPPAGVGIEQTALAQPAINAFLASNHMVRDPMRDQIASETR